jgi:CheY-like chemotaxis protein
MTKKVLVVDDNLVIKKFLKNSLSEYYDIILAESAEEALEKLNDSSIQIVVTDIVMPGMSGIELLRRIKQKYPFLPVIVMSSFSNYKDAIELLNYGGTTFIKKPFSKEDIKLLVDKFIEYNIEFDFEINDAENENNIVIKNFQTEFSKKFVIPSDLLITKKVIYNIIYELKRNFVLSDYELKNINIVLHESIMNAIEHGNFDISFEEKDDTDKYMELLNERKIKSRYRNKKVFIYFYFDEFKIIFKIKDEGNGFDHIKFKEKLDAQEFLFASHGRGIMLVNHFMDNVEFNDIGNEITITKLLNKIENIEN